MLSKIASKSANGVTFYNIQMNYYNKRDIVHVPPYITRAEPRVSTGPDPEISLTH